MNFTCDLHRAIMSHNLILVYQGGFTQEATKSILTLAERNLESSREHPAIKRKVFNVVMESLQNIVKHNDELHQNEHRSHKAVFLIRKERNRYAIMSGNTVDRKKVQDLKTRLDRINSLDKEGLKELYKNTLKGTTISEKGGAGLGFLNMARKSDETLWFDFEKVSETHSFFRLKVSLSCETQN